MNTVKDMISMISSPKLLIMLLIAAGVIAVIYFLIIRPWILRMGVTDEELNMTMPGDGLVKSPNLKYMQAITIGAPAEYVWAYLIQVGYRRAGWYNWDFINRMAAKDYFYENNRSADRVIPEFQNLREGDKVYLTPQQGMDVSELKNNQSMLLTVKENGRCTAAWSYMLKELDKDTTRLYVRWTSHLGDGFMFRLLNFLIVEPGGTGIQQHQMLLGIKRRSEADYRKARVSLREGTSK